MSPFVNNGKKKVIKWFYKVFHLFLTDICLSVFYAAHWNVKLYWQLGTVRVLEFGKMEIPFFCQFCGILWSDQLKDSSSDSRSQNRFTELTSISFRSYIVIRIAGFFFPSYNSSHLHLKFRAGVNSFLWQKQVIAVKLCLTHRDDLTETMQCAEGLGWLCAQMGVLQSWPRVSDGAQLYASSQAACKHQLANLIQRYYSIV